MLRRASTMLLGAATAVLLILASLTVPSTAFATPGKDDYPKKWREAVQSCSSDGDGWGFCVRECTSFVAWRINNDNKYAFSNSMRGPNGKTGRFGNAVTWAANAKAIGFVVDKTPRVGAIAHWDGNAGLGAYGHVAWVKSVNDDGTITIEEYNYTNGGKIPKGSYGTRTISKSNPSNYIHIGDGEFTKSPQPRISGTAVVDQTLKATIGTWSPKPTYSFQWQRDGVNIPGATGKTYTLTSADVGSKIRFRVRAVKRGYFSLNRYSVRTATVEKAKLTRTPVPTISGKATVGQKVQVNAGTWAPAKVNLKYQWFIDDVAIAGATGTTYTLKTKDAGKRISVTVTGRKSGYNSVISKSKTKTVMKAMSAKTPKISGTLKPGKTLRVSTGNWRPKDSTFSYQWRRDGKAISGATSAKYKLKSADKGKRISVKVTAKANGYATTSATSKRTAKVLK